VRKEEDDVEFIIEKKEVTREKTKNEEIEGRKGSEENKKESNDQMERKEKEIKKIKGNIEKNGMKKDVSEKKIIENEKIKSKNLNKKEDNVSLKLKGKN
jgi:hypothetical protein